jgi:hypothetical protein
LHVLNGTPSMPSILLVMIFLHVEITDTDADQVPCAPLALPHLRNWVSTVTPLPPPIETYRL